MNELFGISMTTIMLVMLALFAVCAAGVGVVYISNRLMFRMGLRNIRRRRAQSLLIVSGLMLATVIITAAFATGDTLDYSITKLTYDNLQRTDLSIHHFRAEDTPAGSSDSIAEERYVPYEVTAALEEIFRDDPDIQGFMPFLFEPLPIVNPRTRLSEPFAFVAGFDAERLARFGGLTYADGGKPALSSLGADEALLGEAAAGKLDARTGDTILLAIGGELVPLRVAGIVRDERSSGALEFGGEKIPALAVRLETLQQMTGRAGQINSISVALYGTVRSSLSRTDAAATRLEAFAADPSARQRAGLGGLVFQVEKNKQDAVHEAEMVGNLFTTMFIVMGLFSIAAGAMLIFTLFVMLAAERRTEMGIARAVGAQRINLVQSFLAEGMAYDLLAGLVGVALGVAAAFILVVGGVRLAFGDVLYYITPHVTARSLVVSFCLGAVLTFVTVAVSSFRISYLNIVAAIRGQADGRDRQGRRGHTRWPWILLSVPAMLLPPLGLYLLLRKGLGLAWGRILGPAALVTAGLFMWAGLETRQAFFFTLGVSLIPLGLAAIGEWYRLPRRPMWSAVGAFLAIYWLSPSDWHSAIFGEFKSNMEMFVFSGIMIVTAMTLLIVWNARLLTSLFAVRSNSSRYRPALVLGLLTLLAITTGVLAGDLADGLGQLFFMVAVCTGLFGVLALVSVRFPRFAPALKMGIAYPLASRFRTGMTIAMFSLVVFAITVMGIINSSFLDMFAGDEGTGGWDILASTNRNNPVDDLAAALRDEGSFDPSMITATGRTTQFDNESQEARSPGGEWTDYPIIAGDDSFFREAHMELEGRARGYDSDREVYEAVRTTPGVALIDSSAVQPAGMGGSFGGLHLNVDIEDGTFEPFQVEIRDPVTGRARMLTVAGVFSGRIPGNILFGIYVNETDYRALYGEPDYQTWYLRLADGADSERAAKAIKAALVTKGVQAESIEQMIEDVMAMSRGFMRVLQSFMALGLFVGIAALGVISLRSVVERRQQIGMLRAIGYQRGTVALSFMLESGFIALMGIASGVIGASILAWSLLTSTAFAGTARIGFAIPWPDVIGYSLTAFVFSLLATWWPSSRASSVAVADALRYE